MARKNYTAEQIISKLREVEVKRFTRDSSRRSYTQYRSKSTNILPLAQRIWWNENKSGKEIEGTRERKSTT